MAAATGGGSRPSSSASSLPGLPYGVPSPEQLQAELKMLENAVQEMIAEEVSIRNANMSFNLQNETTQLLISACEKLAIEKEAMNRANFEEHTSELPFMCRHFSTAIEAGLTDREYRAKIAASSPNKALARREKRRNNRWMFALCCQLDFPPQQSWWIDVTQQLAPCFQVVRGGRLAPALPADLCQGDVTYIYAGQRAAADGRVLVHSEGTALDVSHVADLGLQDVRLCSSDANAIPLTASGNIVLKDSYLISGALFCMVVRPASSPFVPTVQRDPEEEEFRVDISVPPGMSASQCRSLFKSLCIKARLACRSFWMMAMLARVKGLVVLLSQDLIEKGTVPQLVSTAKRLNKRLFFVDGGCRKDSLEALAKEIEFEFISLNNSDSVLALVAGITPMQSLSPRDDGRDAENEGGGAAKKAANAEAEKERIRVLVEDKASPGVVLIGISQGGLLSLCARLKEAGMTPLFAMGQFSYPSCFKALTATRFRHLQTNSGGSSAADLAVPKVSYVATARRGSESQQLPRMSKTEAGLTHSTASKGSNDTGRSDDMSPSQAGASKTLSRVGSNVEVSSYPSAMDPSTGLEWRSLSKANAAKHIDVFVSLNSIGVVSEAADCVLLRSDLGCFATALDIASRGVPADVDHFADLQ